MMRRLMEEGSWVAVRFREDCGCANFIAGELTHLFQPSKEAFSEVVALAVLSLREDQAGQLEAAVTAGGSRNCS